MFLFKNNMATKKITFHIENDEEEERVTISIKGIGKVILAVTFPEYEFLEDIGEDGLEELNVEEGDLIGKIEHLEINDEYKGQGYAKILMNKAIELAKEKGLMPLYLNASPMGSKRYGLDVDDLTGFYESLGFEVFLRQGGNNLMILKDTYKTGGETKNKIMAKQIKIQFEDNNYANGGVTYIEWSKDNVWQEQFNDWKEDGNVSKNADGTYSTQDAQYTNSLKGISGLKKYFYNEFIRGQYAEGGITDNNHLIAKAIEFIIGTAIDKDSIEIEPTEISYKRKNINVRTSIDKKLINDTILMHRKSLEGRYAKGGSVGKGYNVFNYTDNIYATDEVFKTEKLANDFIKEFRNRFSKQGYYRDNQMNKIDIEDIDLLAIPSDFNPFGKYADGGEVMVDGLTKQDFIDAYLKRVDSVIENLTQKGEYDSEDFDLLGEVDSDGGFTEIEDVGFWLDWANTKGDYDALTEFISVYDFSDLNHYTFNTLAHLYFGKPMKIDFNVNSGGDAEYDYNNELQKIKLLLNKIDFNKVVGSIDYNKTTDNTDLDFYKDIELVMSLNGDWNETTEELDTTIVVNGETAELNYHPLDSMGGLDLTQLQENINEALKELNTYSAVVSIEGYEEYAEDVEGLENAKALMQDIKGNTRFQVLKGSSVGIGKRVDDSRVIEEFARGGETKTPKKYIVKGYVYDGGEIWKETFDNIDEAYELAYQIQNGWTDDGTYRLITIYDEKGKKVATISDDKYFNELTEHKLFKKVYLGADTKKERQVENEKLKGYKFNLQIRIADGGATGIFEKTFDSIFEVMDKAHTYYEEDYYARINDESLDYWEDKYSEIDLSRNYIKGKYGWSFIKENGYWIAKGDYDENHIVRLEKGKPVADSSVTKGALKQIMELEAQKKYSEKPKHNKSLSDMKKIWDKLSNNYKEREDIAFLIGRYGGLLSDIVPNKWNDLDKSIQIQIMNAYFGKTEEEKQKIINQTRKHHQELVKKHKTLRNLYGKKYADGGETMYRKFYAVSFWLKDGIDAQNWIKENGLTNYELEIEEGDEGINGNGYRVNVYNLGAGKYNTLTYLDSIVDTMIEEFAKGGEAGKDIYDFDKKMALINLGQVYEYAIKIDKMIKENTDLEEWVKMKLTRVEQNIADVKHSLEGWEKYKNGGQIAKKQLLHIAKYSKDLIKMINGGSKLMSWQENKLAISSDSIDNIYHHLDYKMGNRAEDLDNNSMEMGGDVDFVEAQINDIVNWDNDEIASYLQIPVNEVANNRLEYIEEAQNSMLVNQVDGNYAKGGEASFDDAGTSMVLYHEKKGNWLVPKGQVYLYLYDVEDSGSKLGNEFDWVFYPMTSRSMAWQSGYIPPLKKIWTKKFQKDHKGSEHLLGVIKAYLIEEDGKKELFIDMMSVNPTKKKKGVMSYMIKDLRDTFNLSQDQVTFSDLTDEGKKFVAKKTYADGGEAESMNFFVVKNENDKYYNWVGYNVDETITDKQGNEFEKLYFENKKLPKKYNVNDLIYLEQRDTFTQKDKYGGSDTEYVILVNYQYSSKPFDFYYYLYNVTKKFVATEGNLDWVKSNLPRGWKFYSSYADGGETSGLITDEQVKDLSFKIKIKNVPLKKGVLLHEIVTLEEFDLPDEENINFYPFHLIYGDSSLSIFDAFGVDEVAGLKRKDCEEFINNLKAQGKTEKDGSFMAGLTNYVGDKLFMFFNVARLSYEGFANRVLPHEALHLSRSLISLYKNDWVRENLNTPKWWEDKRAVFVDMGDSNEEFFAETLERTTAIAMDGWYRVTGQKCVVEKNKTYADGGKIGKLKVLQKIVYESIKNKPSKSITTYNLPSDTRKILEELYYMDLLDRNYINGTQEAEYTLKYANGGDVPHEDKMFQLPLEMVVYVPSTQDVDKVISVDKMVTRVDEVKEYLASKFGGYTSADKLGGFVDSTGNLVNEDVVQVTAFATKEAYAQYKEELIHQLALWGKKWGQEAIGFEFEGDLMYVPQEL